MLDACDAANDLAKLGGGPYTTVLADPPWRFSSRSGKISPEYKWQLRYETLRWQEIAELPVDELTAEKAHCYLWVPNALLAEGLRVLEAWGFEYKTMIVWAKRRKDGGPDGRGVGFYFRNTTEAVLFGTKGRLRTLNPGRRQVNIIDTMRREHSRKPDELYDIIESCSPASYLELFARYPRDGWTSWGNEAGDTVVPRGKQHANFRGAKISRVTNLVPLLEAGLLSPHQNLVLRKRGGAEYGAKVLADGSIELDSGGVFSSPTDAAKAAGGYVSTDGWIRWRDRESDLTLATLRDKLSLEV